MKQLYNHGAIDAARAPGTKKQADVVHPPAPPCPPAHTHTHTHLVLLQVEPREVILSPEIQETLRKLLADLNITTTPEVRTTIIIYN